MKELSNVCEKQVNVLYFNEDESTSLWISSLRLIKAVSLLHFAPCFAGDQVECVLSERVTNGCGVKRLFWTSSLVPTDAACPHVPPLCQKYQAGN